MSQNERNAENLARSAGHLKKAMRAVQRAEIEATNGGRAADPRFAELVKTIKALGWQVADCGTELLK